MLTQQLPSNTLDSSHSYPSGSIRETNKGGIHVFLLFYTTHRRTSSAHTFEVGPLRAFPTNLPLMKKRIPRTKLSIMYIIS
jgi:hypothetical protein